MEAVIYAIPTSWTGQEDAAALMALAHARSPHVERLSAREIALGVDGASSCAGDSRAIARELRRCAADRGLQVRVAIAGSRTAARLVVRHRAGLTVLEPGTEPVALAGLPLAALAALSSGGDPAGGLTADDAVLLASLRRLGLRTLGDLVRCPAGDLASRAGARAVIWQRMARGEDVDAFVVDGPPGAVEAPVEAALDLESPIEGLEPLSFVLGRLIEPIAARLERGDRRASVLRVRLHLVGRPVHDRRLEVPAAVCDARSLRMLALLDLESHPPDAPIARVAVAAESAPDAAPPSTPRCLPGPGPGRLSTLLARLGAVVGEGRCGSPAEVTSGNQGAVAMRPFSPPDVEVPDSRARAHAGRVVARAVADAPAITALRRFRFAVPARVTVEHGRPVRLHTDRRGLPGGRVEDVARAVVPDGSFGGWSRDREEWDLSLSDGATYRVFRERAAGTWFVEGIVD